MNIREVIKEVRYIYYFSGGLAFFRAEDEKGSYQGLIDQDGEIVWDVKWRTPAIRLWSHPDYIQTANEKKEWIYLDVRTLQFVPKPEVLKKKEQSRARKIVNSAPDEQFIKGVETFFAIPAKKYLNEAYIAFHEQDRDVADEEKGSLAAFFQRKWGVQDLEGEVVLPAIYDGVKAGFKDNHFVVKYDGLCGVIDDKKQWIIPREYADMFCLGESDNGNTIGRGYVAFIKADKQENICGLIDERGDTLLPFEYENIFPSPTEDLITVKKAGQWKVINSKSETVFEIGK